MRIEVRDLPAWVSSTGKPKFYISRGEEYMRSDGEWMTCMDPRGSDWHSGGTYFSSREEDEAALSEVQPAETPVRTVTRKEIVSGQYGLVEVYADRPTGNPRIKMSCVPLPSELRTAAATLIEIADALEESNA